MKKERLGVLVRAQDVGGGLANRPQEHENRKFFKALSDLLGEVQLEQHTNARLMGETQVDEPVSKKRTREVRVLLAGQVLEVRDVRVLEG